MLILDATAGDRAMWFDKNYTNTIYIDIRLKMKPTVVSDVRCLPFKNAPKRRRLPMHKPHHRGLGI